MRRALIALVLLALPVAGCYPPPGEVGLENQNQPEVARVPVRTTLAVAGDHLSRKAANRLTALARDWQARGLGPLRVTVQAPDAATARSIAGTVRGALIGGGGPPEDLVLETETGADGASATVHYQQARLRLPDCSAKQGTYGTTFNNLEHPNLGCATRRNIGLMLADPRDLVRPRSGENVNGPRTERALRRFRTGRDTRSQGMEPVNVDAASSGG